jgi:hypothetical protein
VPDENEVPSKVHDKQRIVTLRGITMNPSDECKTVIQFVTVLHCAQMRRMKVTDNTKI